ncbi:unnamed protein product [Polarella glacialis]|uniref:Heme NO-binding domain-containing protein n=1 Tax=Polarella glacialis TaxID=89957 RepID=A0A813KIT1_POLGL|nr:unnamed protein product [Polarella glacialis]
MHGLLHIIFKDFIVKTFGHEPWAEIIHRAGVDNDATILRMEQYDDSLTFALVKIGSEVLQVEIDEVLEPFGEFFVDFAVEAGYYNQLTSLGSNLFDLMTNLNLFHHNLERDFRSSVFPVFVVEGKTESVFQLRYSSSRIGLEPLLRGVLIKIAKDLFHADLTIEVVKSPGWKGPPQIASPEDDPTVIWNLKVQKRPKTQESPSFSRTSTLSSTGPGSQPAGRSYSFFDFHAMFVSCCKSAVDFEHVAATNWQAEMDVVLQLKSAAVRRIYDHSKGVKATVSQRMGISRVLFRSVSASLVAAPWQDEAAMEKASQFWTPLTTLDGCYTWSKDIERSRGSGSSLGSAAVKITFLSHSWQQPGNWDAAMGEGCSYSAIKASEICNVAKDLAALDFGDYSRWPEIHFWVDKCCIPQAHPELMTWCLDLLEEFIALSDRLVVILSWSYFDRLWCVYEWVCFLIHNKASSIFLCVDAFVRSRTLPLLLESVKNFSLANCKCSVESDRQILTRKVDTYYISHDAFEQLLKFTAIALISRDMASRRTAMGAEAIAPWVELSKECGFEDLAACLTHLIGQLSTWRQDSATGDGRFFGLDMQTAILQKVDAWFAKDIEPLIDALKKKALRAAAKRKSQMMMIGLLPYLHISPHSSVQREKLVLEQQFVQNSPQIP